MLIRAKFEMSNDSSQSRLSTISYSCLHLTYRLQKALYKIGRHLQSTRLNKNDKLLLSPCDSPASVYSSPRGLHIPGPPESAAPLYMLIRGRTLLGYQEGLFNSIEGAVENNHSEI